MAPALRHSITIVLVGAAHLVRPAAVLIPAFWHHIEIMIVDIEHVVPACVARVAVENIAALVPEKHAMPFSVGRPWILHGVVKEGLLLGHLFLGKGYAIVEIEIGIA